MLSVEVTGREGGGVESVVVVCSESGDQGRRCGEGGSWQTVVGLMVVLSGASVSNLIEFVGPVHTAFNPSIAS